MRHIGSRVPRREDPDLLTGRARTVADLRPVDVGASQPVLEAAFVRSPVSHGLLRAVDAAPARAVAGVVGAWSAADLPDLPRVPVPDPSSAPAGLDRDSLARDRVRFTGEAVAVVLATSRAAAEDGAAAVHVDVQPLPPVATVADALAAGAPLLFPDREQQDDVVSTDWTGTPADEVAATIEAAGTDGVVVEASFRQQRLLPSSLEGRTVLAVTGEDGSLAVWASHQAQHRLAHSLATAFGLEEHRVRVVVPATGGAFGAKSQTYPEHLVVAHLARLTGRPVRWVEDRAEALTAAPRGRGQDQRTRLAATPDGRFLAYELRLDADIGAYPQTGANVPHMTAGMAPGAYATPQVAARVRTVLTSTPPTASYRGAGRPEAAFALERTVDLMARRLGIDPAELRRRNFVRTFPHTTPMGRPYDSGDYAAALDVALSEVGYDAWRAEQARRRREGGLPVGIGLCTYVERSGAEGTTDELGSVEVVPRDGQPAAFVVRVGSTNTGQGHLTSFAQVAAGVLDVDLDRVGVLDNDTAQVPYGFGTFGSRSMQVGGAAVWTAAQHVVDASRERYAQVHGVHVAGVAWDGGRLSAPGAPEVEVGDLVAGTAPLRIDERHEAPWSFPYGAYAAVVEVDPELGDVRVLRLVAVDDYGVVVNPMVVDGQGYGSVAQGLGQALWESAEPAADGSPIARSWLELLLPVSGDVPEVVLRETVHPNPNVPHGAKGAGEAGCIGVPPALVNAVCDALDVDDVPMPMTPERVWRAARSRHP